MRKGGTKYLHSMTIWVSLRTWHGLLKLLINNNGPSLGQSGVDEGRRRSRILLIRCGIAILNFINGLQNTHTCILELLCPGPLLTTHTSGEAQDSEGSVPNSRALGTQSPVGHDMQCRGRDRSLARITGVLQGNHHKMSLGCKPGSISETPLLHYSTQFHNSSSPSN